MICSSFQKKDKFAVLAHILTSFTHAISGENMKSRITFLCLILAFCVIFAGCGKEYSYGKVERDSALTGGNLTFVYDEATHTATFGGEGETIAYYSAQAGLGQVAGNRIGFKIYAPCEVTDYSKAKLNFQGEEITGGGFMQTVYGQVMNYFVLTPVVSEDNRQLEVKVAWTQDAEAQVYTIKVADGTKFVAGE